MKESENYVMPFGKYEGETLLQIKDHNKAYLEWTYHALDESKISQEIKSHIENLLSI